MKDGVKKLKDDRKIKKTLLFAIAAAAVCLISVIGTDSPKEPERENTVSENSAAADRSDGRKELSVSVNAADYYTTNKGDPSNLYFIDGDGVLWGSGRNEYGQLGQGTQDDEFHSENIKIAERVIHVDYSQRGFTIFLTEDHRLYGMDNGRLVSSCGSAAGWNGLDLGRKQCGQLWRCSSRGDQRADKGGRGRGYDLDGSDCGRCFADFSAGYGDGVVWKAEI